MEGVVPMDQLWIRDTWEPLAMLLGLKRVAVVLAPRGLSRFASEEILRKSLLASLTRRLFTTMSEATGLGGRRLVGATWHVTPKHF